MLPASTRARDSQKPLQAPSPDPPARSIVHGQFRDRAPNSHENQLRAHGYSDRYEAEGALKGWHRGEIDEIDRRMRDAVDQLREERDKEIEQDQRDLDELKAKHKRLHDEARRELRIPGPKEREQVKAEPVRFENLADQRQPDLDHSPAVPPPLRLPDGTIRLVVDAERFEKFRELVRSVTLATPEPEQQIETDRYGNEIIDMTGPVEPEPSRDDPPAYEPDNFIPKTYYDAPARPEPEPDLDWEIGD